MADELADVYFPSKLITMGSFRNDFGTENTYRPLQGNVDFTCTGICSLHDTAIIIMGCFYYCQSHSCFVDFITCDSMVYQYPSSQKDIQSFRATKPLFKKSRPQDMGLF